MKQQQDIGFADLAVKRRKIKEEFFNQLNKILDWGKIEKEISRYYQKGMSVSGRPSYSGLVLFKMCLLQTWYGLSDYEVEDQVNDRISFSRFVGISMDNPVPDHSVLSRFRTAMTEKKAFEKLFKVINKQLESHQIIVKSGLIVDASLTDSPRCPKGKKQYEVVEDRKESEGESTESQTQAEPQPSVQAAPQPQPRLKEKVKAGVDTEASWLKKAGKLRYGFKKHKATDVNGMVRGVVTTTASESDIKHLDDVIDASGELDKGAWAKADKGYKSKENDDVLRKRKIKNHIMHKAHKNKKLTEREQQCNRLISKIRYRVERTFGSMNRWFGAGVARYVGLAKTHTQHLMEAMAYNLYRSPGIVMSNCQN